MLPMLGDLLPYAVPVALSPLPIIAVLVLILAPTGTRGGIGFLVGRVATLAVLTLIVAALAGRVAGPAEPVARGAGMRILLGGMMMLGAAVLWWRTPGGGEAAALPGWMRAIEGAGPARAVRLGLVLTVLNLKELALVVGAGMIAGGAVSLGGQAVAAAIFAAVAGLGVALPVVWTMAAGDRARARLGAGRDWLVQNQAIVMAAVLLVLGAMLVGSGLEAL